jgi:hypothetical protein
LEYSKKEIRKNIWINKEYLQNFYTDVKPRWVKFCEKLLDENYIVFIYIYETTGTVYITVVKNNKMIKIRYSDHLPMLNRWLSGDVDYFVGPKFKGMLTDKEMLNILKIKFRK